MEALEGRRVIVTGGDGFLGTYVVQILQDLGVRRVFVPRSRHYDLTNIDNTYRLLRDYPPNQIIHLASTCPWTTDTNKISNADCHPMVRMWRNLRDTADKNQVSEMVAVVDYHAYPEWCHPPYSDTDMSDQSNWAPCPKPHPYELLLKEALEANLKEGCHLSTSVLIASEIYGPGDRFHLGSRRMMPSVIRAISDAKEQGKTEVAVSGHPDDEMDFLYACDAAEGIVHASKHPSEIGVMNLGSGKVSRWAVVVEQIASYLDYKGEIRWAESHRPARLQSLQTDKAKDTIGFYPATDLESGLKETIRWFCTHRRFILENEVDLGVPYPEVQDKDKELRQRISGPQNKHSY
jgi:GDP-L-fucose synthase